MIDAIERVARASYEACLHWMSLHTETHERDEPWSWEELTEDERQFWVETVTDAILAEETVLA